MPLGYAKAISAWFVRREPAPGIAMAGVGLGRYPALAIAPRIGGAEGDRTPDLRIANATLSQLSYGPIARFELSAGRGGLW